MKASPEELQEWKELASSHDLKMAELIRLLLSNEKPKRKRAKPNADPQLLRAINAIGNNLNQIARRVNTGEKPDIIPHLVSIEQQLQDLLDAHKIH